MKNTLTLLLVFRFYNKKLMMLIEYSDTTKMSFEFLSARLRNKAERLVKIIADGDLKNENLDFVPLTNPMENRNIYVLKLSNKHLLVIEVQNNIVKVLDTIRYDMVKYFRHGA